MTKIEEAAVVPDFSLADTENRQVHLSDYRGEKNIFLVFNRGFF